MTRASEDIPTTADLVAYLREHRDEWHQTAAARLEAYDAAVRAALMENTE